jgi:hypothetical protein
MLGFTPVRTGRFDVEGNQSIRPPLYTVSPRVSWLGLESRFALLGKKTFDTSFSPGCEGTRTQEALVRSLYRCKACNSYFLNRLEAACAQ